MSNVGGRACNAVVTGRERSWQVVMFHMSPAKENPSKQHRAVPGSYKGATIDDERMGDRDRHGVTGSTHGANTPFNLYSGGVVL